MYWMICALVVGLLASTPSLAQQGSVPTSSERTAPPGSKAEADLERAWACDPFITVRGRLEFRDYEKCPDRNPLEERQRSRLLEILRQTYKIGSDPFANPDDPQFAAFLAEKDRRDLERAWACDPYIYERGRLAFRAHEKCPEENRLLELLSRTYRRGADQMGPDDPSFAAFLAEKDRRAKAAEATAQRVKDDRKRKLRSGALKVESFEDAKLLHDPVKNLGDIAISPLLSPDALVYAGTVTLDIREKPNLIRAKTFFLAGNVVSGASVDFAYVWLRVTKKSANLVADSLRIGGNVGVVGRYTQNVEYRTVIGEQKTAPVLEVLYLAQ
jgi:hypothetical protein